MALIIIIIIIRWSGYQTGAFACTSHLFGLGGQHLGPPDTDLVVGFLLFRYVLAAWQNAHDSPSLLAALLNKQSFWDQPGIQSARAQVEAHYSEPQQTACFLAAATPHSGNWLLALPISGCRQRLSDKAV